MGLPDWRATHNANALWSHLTHIHPSTDSHLRPGDLCFWGAADGGPINHVMLWWGDGRVYGACGGDHTTISVEEAVRRGAKVQFRPKADYRKHFIGWAASPFQDIPRLKVA
jgi:cell wall-associated NlpC family hydrolase